jgi:hypothetical protein
LDFIKKPLVATMSEVPLHLAPPVQEISQHEFHPAPEEEVIDVAHLSLSKKQRKRKCKLITGKARPKPTHTPLNKYTVRGISRRCCS